MIDFVSKKWVDKEKGHVVLNSDCLDVVFPKANAIIQDPPYNIKIGEFKKSKIPDYIKFSNKWVQHSSRFMKKDSSLYIWLGAEIKDHFQPLPEFMLMMRDNFPELKSKNFITMRNQRGYGTQKNWMPIRQELLYYIKGEPTFNVQYTEIKKKTKGFYKTVNGKKTENIERSKSENIRPGNVWHDIQQVFFLSKENVGGCYAQKPLKAIERIIEASTNEGDIVIDFFSHAGTTLLACEKLNRRCFCVDINPVYAKISVARLLHYRITNREGWGKTDVIKGNKIVLDDESLLNL